MLRRCKELSENEIKFLKKENLDPNEFLLINKGADNYEFYHIKTCKKISLRR